MDDQNYLPQQKKITIFSIKREGELKNAIKKLRADSPLILPDYFDSRAYSILEILESEKSCILQGKPYTVAWAVVFSLLRDYVEAEIIRKQTKNTLNTLYDNSKIIRKVVGEREWERFNLGKIEFKPDYLEDLKYERFLRPSPRKILTELFKGPSYRKDLNRTTKLSNSTVTAKVNKLIAAGLVTEEGKYNRKKRIFLTEEGARLVEKRMSDSGTSI